jgi:predicted O-linked N-acetylglucosamine transferase (SPINDLY family)
MALNEDSLFQKALVLGDEGDFLGSRRLFEKLSDKYLNDPVFNFYSGLNELNLNQYERAISYFNKSIQLKPGDAFAIQALGTALSMLGRYSEALVAFDQVSQINPNYPDVFNDKGVVLTRMGDFEQSLPCFESAIKLEPTYADAYSNYGFSLFCLKKYKEAVVSYDNAIKLNSRSANSHFYRAEALREIGFHELALKGFDATLNFSEDRNFLSKVHINRALSMQELGKLEDALEAYDLALKFDSDELLVELYLIAAKMQICNWVGFEELREVIFKKIKADKHFTLPLNLAYIHDELDLLRKSAQKYIKSNDSKIIEFNKTHKSNKKIRIGYFSADFHQHPVSHLTAEIFELHNRDHFEVIAFSLLPNKDSMRDRLENAFDQFLDMESKDDEEIVSIARNMEIDIAVDLGGFTKNARTGIFALRAAPVQVNYLGYPGTMGANFMDYIIADSVVIPSELKSLYTERVAYLPNSFMPSDSKIMPANKKTSRQDVGLPEDRFVFCCFFPAIKLTPEVFSSWMRILTAVKDSVLWLSRLNVKAMENLKAAAESMGVGSERIIFASREDLMGDHLNRLRMADLFLDTYPYNAHTTANDALKVGLPLITIMGQSFASRVASSLLSAVSLQELIVNNIHDYESLAISLASDPVNLKQIRQKLMNNIKTSTLFDTKVFTNNIELLYKEMYRRYQNELPAEDIYIE